MKHVRLLVQTAATAEIDSPEHCGEFCPHLWRQKSKCRLLKARLAYVAGQFARHPECVAAEARGKSTAQDVAGKLHSHFRRSGQFALAPRGGR